MFDADQWKTLQSAVVWVFELISSADGKVDKKEYASLNIILKKINAFASPLMKEVLTSIENIETLFGTKGRDVRAVKQGLEDLRKLIDYKFEPADEFEIKKDYVAIGFYIALASGSFFGDKISDEEMDTLNELGVLLNFPVKHVIETNAIDKIIAKINE